MKPIVIETEGLTKKYETTTAVDHLNLTVSEGEVFGLLGPNGAGKTTTILMLMGLTDRTSGKASVLGYDPARQPLKVKSRVGYLPDQVGFYDELTAFENLVFTAKLNNLSHNESYERIEKALDRVLLTEVAHHRVQTFSRGMRQRLGVADVLIKNPELIIMDEPTQGLDPEGAREFLDMIRSLRDEHITILISSHLLHQVQEVCDRVGLFHKGKLVLIGTVEELAHKVLGGAYRIRIEAEGDPAIILAKLQAIPGALKVKAVTSKTYEIEAKEDLRAEAAAQVVNNGARLFNLDVEAQSLEDIYAHYFQEVQNARK